MASDRQKRIPETGYVRLPVILQHFPVSKSTWYNGIKAGKYPQGVRISERITAWRASDIRNLLDEESA